MFMEDRPLCQALCQLLVSVKCDNVSALLSGKGNGRQVIIPPHEHKGIREILTEEAQNTMRKGKEEQSVFYWSVRLQSPGVIA